jgi:hypothetical protein
LKSGRDGLRCTFLERGGSIFKMAGFIGFAPIYLNGMLALFFVFMLPGLVFVRAFSIASFPQRWLVVFLSSLTANHFLVTLIAALHFDPLETYRAATLALIAILIFATVRARARSGTPVYRGASIACLSDIGWLLLSLTVLGFAYVNVWKHGVPNIFEEGDVSASWNTWSLIWSQGLFPIYSYGYPQFVPTIWAVTYIFTGSPEQYFAFYIYIVLIIAPIVLSAMVLGRVSWWHPPLFVIVFERFVAEIQEPWLKSTLEEGFPDWVAAIFAFCGAVLFVTNAPEGRFDRDKIVTALISLCMLAIAAATKPIFGLLAMAVLMAICVDAAKNLDQKDRNRFLIAMVGLFSAFVVAYVLNYSHLVVRSMPNYPVPELSKRLSRALELLKANFSLPFRILAFAGLALSPFLVRIRWLSLPLAIGLYLWASTASYDLRNLLGLLLISAFIPLFAAARALLATSVVLARSVLAREPRMRMPDGVLAASLAILSFGFTLTLARGDTQLQKAFANEQLRRGAGFEFNQHVEQLLLRGCTIFSGNAYIFTVSAFQQFKGQMHYFSFSEPLTPVFSSRFDQTARCAGIVYPPSRSHPSIVSFIGANMEPRGLGKLFESNGWVLLVSGP